MVSNNDKRSKKDKPRARSSQTQFLPNALMLQPSSRRTLNNSQGTSDEQRTKLHSISSLGLDRLDRNTTPDQRGLVPPPTLSSAFNQSNSEQDGRGYNNYQPFSANQVPYTERRRKPTQDPYTSYPEVGTAYSSEPRRYPYVDPGSLYTSFVGPVPNSRSNRDDYSSPYSSYARAGILSYGESQRHLSNDIYSSGSSLAALCGVDTVCSTLDKVSSSEISDDNPPNSEQRWQRPHDPLSSIPSDDRQSPSVAGTAPTNLVTDNAPKKRKVGHQAYASYSDRFNLEGGERPLLAWLETRLPPPHEWNIFHGERSHEVLMYKAYSQNNAQLAEDVDIQDRDLSTRLSAAYDYVAHQLDASFEEILTNHTNDRRDFGAITQQEFTLERAKVAHRRRTKPKSTKPPGIVTAPVDTGGESHSKYKTLIKIPVYSYKCKRPGTSAINCWHSSCMQEAEPAQRILSIIFSIQASGLLFHP